ncbi:MAG: ribonuclease HI [Spirochaetaceae bacterium]|nr:MAG: ribonuclease HI [Spirochaetaceae bacterium]
MSTISIYTDGACSGNPGPGGWAAILLLPMGKKEISGNEKQTTNNRMELLAVISALTELEKQAGRGASAEVYTDSQYVKKGITEWIKKWVANGWRNASKDPVKNQDLWKKLLELEARHTVNWHWVKGHADNQYNNACDQLAQERIKELR